MKLLGKNLSQVSWVIHCEFSGVGIEAEFPSTFVSFVMVLATQRNHVIEIC